MTTMFNVRNTTGCITRFLVCVSLLIISSWASAADKPNILLIVLDDAGYSDVAGFGRNDAPTPQLKKIADEGGLNEFKHSIMPEEKASTVKELQKDGKVIFVGDGINDAPVLAAADCGFAMGLGSDAAIDLVLGAPYAGVTTGCAGGRFHPIQDMGSAARPADATLVDGELAAVVLLGRAHLCRADVGPRAWG